MLLALWYLQISYLKEVGEVANYTNYYGGQEFGDDMGQDKPSKQYLNLLNKT